MERKITKYNITKEQEKDVGEALAHMLDVSRRYQLPMFASFAVENSEEETKYKNIIYEASAHDLKLKEDLIRKHMLIANGFDCVPKRDVMAVNLAEVFYVE